MNVNLNLVPDSQNPLSENIVNYKIIEDGYHHPMDNLMLQYDEFNKFIEILKETYDITEYDFTENKKNIFREFHCEEFIMHVSGNYKEIVLNTSSKNIAISKHIFSTYKDFVKEDNETKIFVNSYLMGPQGLTNSVRVLEKEDIETISDSYYPYINNDIMYKQFFTNQESILILAGAPGIGKCLSGDEEIEIYVDDDLYEKLME